MRTEDASYRGFQAGRTGILRSFILDCSGVRLAFRALHATQASAQFSQVVWPPWDRGMTWSIVSSEVPGRDPQYWQVEWSRLNRLRRLKVTAL
jgi:hypothetical protein